MVSLSLKHYSWRIYARFLELQGQKSGLHRLTSRSRDTRDSSRIIRPHDFHETILTKLNER